MDLTPNLLTFAEGTVVTTESWPKRRAELYDLIIPHEYGGMPPGDVRTEAFLRAQGGIRDKTWPKVMYLTYEVRITFADGRDLALTLSLWCPEAEGPLPVVLDGDGCWRYFNDDVVRQILARDNIAASFDRTEAAADNKDCYRRTGLYRLFPDAEFGVLSAWAWAYHRCIDALTSLDYVRNDAIAITGHSRGGKTVLLAGATDERIALTNPNCSGIGGAGLHRLKCRSSEVIDSFFGSGNIFWFGKEFKEYRHRDSELPYDQHFMHALIAPRLFLTTDAYEDHWANPPGAYAACHAAKEVYNLLGKPENIGWAIREEGHAHKLDDYMTLLDFVDRNFHGREVNRNFQRHVYSELDNLLKQP